MEDKSKKTMKKDWSETELVKHLKTLADQEEIYGLKNLLIHKNLATKKFRKIWSDWWKSKLPPRLEVDMIPVFEKMSNEIIIGAVEVEFFKGKTKRFCDGLEQALSFGLFGFDSLVLWHIFSEKMSNKQVEEYSRASNEIIGGLDLPLLYFATKFQKDKFEFFAPLESYSSQTFRIDYIFKYLRNLCREKKNQNPLLKKKEVQKRRKMLKVSLRIPV